MLSLVQSNLPKTILIVKLHERLVGDSSSTSTCLQQLHVEHMRCFTFGALSITQSHSKMIKTKHAHKHDPKNLSTQLQHHHVHQACARVRWPTRTKGYLIKSFKETKKKISITLQPKCPLFSPMLPNSTCFSFCPQSYLSKALQLVTRPFFVSQARSHAHM